MSKFRNLHPWLKGLLDRMSGGGQGSSKVKFDRRRAAMDSDDDDLDDL